MARWRYIFTDLVSGSLLSSHLPLADVSLTSTLNDIGSFSASLQLGDIRVMEQDPMSATIPNRCAMFAAYGNLLVWGGYITGRRSPRSGKMALDGKEFLNYWNRRRIRSHLDPVSRDQLDTARWVLSSELAEQYGSIKIDLPPPGVRSGINRTYGYDGWDLKNAWSELQSLAAEQDGFEFGQELYWDTEGMPRARIMTYYPKKGVSAKDTNLTITNTNADWEFPEDGEAQTTRRYGTGSGDGAAKLIVPLTASDVLAAGWPLLEEEDSYSDIGDRDRVTRWTQQQLDWHRLPVTLPTISTRIDSYPGLGTFTTGDWLNIRLQGWNFPSNDPRQMGRYATKLRVSSMTITPKDGKIALTMALS